VPVIDGLGAKTHNSSDFLKKVKSQEDEKDLEKKLSELPKNLTE
jgi:hypothetical protein